ncbi:hypothetical protein [Ammoniphilus sp. 3BR4]|uniref:hypothetical protein n=1 Tax=Ammoniphilus sp. 3BR4 TaxID=3158265 RepID=UPI0034666A24
MSLVEKIFKNLKRLIMKNKNFMLNPSNSTPSRESSKRFYPPSITPHEHEPTRDKFDIIQRDAFGEGVVSKIKFQAADLLFRFSGTPLPYQTLYTLQKQRGLYIEDPYFMGKILHSCDPNTFVNMETQEFWAIKDIFPGDFITMDYEATEDELYRSFECTCGSQKCRKRIKGKEKGGKG